MTINDYEWGDKQAAVDLLGWHEKTLRSKCNSNSGLIEGAHFSRATGTLRFNLTLLRDALANGFGTPAHQQAIDAYVAALPSNQRRRRSA